MQRSTSVRVETNSRKLIKLLEADGWRFVGATGDHHHFKHPDKPVKVTVPHPNKDISIKTVLSVYLQAGWRRTK
jgi:predicted RNA binding protein YcfA (HicA-like mRNA interferase family)